MTTYHSYSDQELTALLKEGNQSAFNVLYERYKGVLHGHAYKKLGNLEEAKDLIQELFMSLWSKRASLPETTNLSGYLYTTLRNRILDVIAHQKVESKYTQSLQNFITDANFTTDRTVRERELAALIEQVIGELPPKMREVFLMSRTTGKSHQQIAEELDIAESTVKNHIKAALKVLRNKLGLLAYLMFLIKF
jgi:RNA polymerase sigma-70 factor (family 1)